LAAVPRSAGACLYPDESFFFKKDYLQGLSGDEQTIFLNEKGQKMVLFTLVSVPSGHPEKASTNLLSPLVIDAGSRTGRQVVLPHTAYSHRHPLFDAHPDPTL
jgi:flagellar assembly factor FliW